MVASPVLSAKAIAAPLSSEKAGVKNSPSPRTSSGDAAPPRSLGSQGCRRIDQPAERPLHVDQGRKERRLAGGRDRLVRDRRSTRHRLGGSARLERGRDDRAAFADRCQPLARRPGERARRRVREPDGGAEQQLGPRDERDLLGVAVLERGVARLGVREEVDLAREAREGEGLEPCEISRRRAAPRDAAWRRPRPHAAARRASPSAAPRGRSARAGSGRAWR